MTKRKVASKKRVTRKSQPKSVFDRLESGFLGKPIEVANKTFLASLGVVATMQTEFMKFQSDFGNTYEKLVRDGELARNRYRADFKDLREDVSDFSVGVAEDIVDAKDRVVANVRSAVAD